VAGEFAGKTRGSNLTGQLAGNRAPRPQAHPFPWYPPREAREASAQCYTAVLCARLGLFQQEVHSRAEECRKPLGQFHREVFKWIT